MTMNISLPDSLKAFIEKQVQTGRYKSPSAYVETLICEDEKRQGEVGEALPVDQHFEAHLDALLEEAEESGEPEEMTSEDWEGIEQEAMAILKTRKSA
jgi:antitoxin ParD1/3/4